MSISDLSLRGLSLEDSVEAAAVDTLDATLCRVEHSAKLAATSAKESPEFVHQLRIATRRAAAAISIYEPLLPRREVRWFRKKLKALRRAAGLARDLDVLVLAYQAPDGRAAKKFRKRLNQKRKQAQVPIEELHSLLIHEGKFATHRTRMLEKLRSPSLDVEPVRFGAFARERLEVVSARFFDSAPRRLKKLRALHRFRIRGKQLRYSMELLAPAFASSFEDELLTCVRQLLGRLGKINDQVVKCKKLERWLKTKGAQRGFLKEQLKESRRELKRRMKKLQKTWESEISHVRTLFAKHLE